MERKAEGGRVEPKAGAEAGGGGGGWSRRWRRWGAVVWSFGFGTVERVGLCWCLVLLRDFRHLVASWAALDGITYGLWHELAT